MQVLEQALLSARGANPNAKPDGGAANGVNGQDRERDRDQHGGDRSDLGTPVSQIREAPSPHGKSDIGDVLFQLSNKMNKDQHALTREEVATLLQNAAQSEKHRLTLQVEKEDLAAKLQALQEEVLYYDEL